ncbi:hypothetical protein [Dysgonomonas massiliensis]|uniref:hypothetical protein n=1 Tax=Dysgonomonas massiliensis TaxID=2040292 RepID=UPI000C788B5B|nr:hypothetical protein [Dysgonomonas massiliensis]
MKKLLFGLLIAIAFMSCKGDDGRDGVDGKDGVDGFTNMEVVDVRVGSEQWVVGKDDFTGESFFYYDWKIEELTEHRYDNGALVPYMMDLNPEIEVKHLMPYSLSSGDKIATYTIDYEPAGYVRFYVKYSDLSTTKTPPTVDYVLVFLGDK